MDGTTGPQEGRETDGEGPASPQGARWSLLLLVAALVLALDQASKAWAVAVLGDGRIIDVVGSLRLRLTLNYGSAFSLADGRGPLISLLALVVVVVLLRTGRHATKPSMAVALGLVVGGAFGNLIDRAVRSGDGFLGGGVVDFLDLQWWPVFNVADSAIVVGALLLFVLQWREGEPPAEVDATPTTTAAGPDAGASDAGAPDESATGEGASDTGAPDDPSPGRR